MAGQGGWLALLVLIWRCVVVAGVSPCCQQCIDLRPTNTEEICNDAGYVAWFSCPTPATCYLHTVYDNFPTLVVRQCQDCPEGWARNQLCQCQRCELDAPPNSICTPEYGKYVSKRCAPNQQRECLACSACPTGTEKSETCTLYEDTKCQTCAAGKYRSSLSVLTCQTCKTCDTAQRQKRSPCGPVNDRVCETCPTGHIVTGADKDTCTPCDVGIYAGKYAKASDNACVGCKDCDRRDYQATACQAAADRSCTPCPAGLRTLNLNSAECLGCIAGYIRASNTCVECISKYTVCTDGHYVRCTTSADGNGDYDCPFCEGQAEVGSASCNAGYGVSTRCDGKGMATVSCTACAAGTERPASTQLENFIQKCKQCATGYYKAAAGASACGACAASPANSVYAEWGTTLATSSDCPW